MNPWKILGIPETTDRSAVKKAYTRLIKACHPEDDPAGFQRIRQAYELAFKQMEILELDEDAIAEETIPARQFGHSAPPAGQEATDPSVFEPPSEEPLQPEMPPLSPHIARALSLLEQSRDLLADKQAREQLENWERILSNDALWNIEANGFFSDSLFIQLTELRMNEVKKLWLPAEVWKTLDEHCNWRHQELRLYKLMPENQVNSVLDRIRSAFGEMRSFDVAVKDQPKVRFPGFTVSWRMIIILLFLLSRILTHGCDGDQSKTQGHYRPVHFNGSDQFVFPPAERATDPREMYLNRKLREMENSPAPTMPISATGSAGSTGHR